MAISTVVHAGSAKKAGSARKGAAVGALLRQLRSAARGVANEQHRPAGAKRKREADEYASSCRLSCCFAQCEANISAVQDQTGISVAVYARESQVDDCFWLEMNVVRSKHTCREEEHRTLVAFDTNVFMGSAKDRNIIMECQRVWRGLDPQIHILLPRVSAPQLC